MLGVFLTRALIGAFASMFRRVAGARTRVLGIRASARVVGALAWMSGCIAGAITRII